MRIIKIIIAMITVQMGLFFVLSSIGLLWVDSYEAVISNPGWFWCYTIFIGWWVSILVADDLFELFERSQNPKTK